MYGEPLSPRNPWGRDNVGRSIITLNNDSMSMATTITVEKETRDRLMSLKLDGEYASLDALLRDMLVEFRRARLRRASTLMRRKMAEKGLSLKDLIG